MKKLLLILLCLPFIGFGQQTYIPDDGFEQSLINVGYDNVLDNYVLTAAIDSVSYLNVSNQNISDLTGIEDFTSLTYLECWSNQLTYLDLSDNTSLTYLSCIDNQLTSLDVSQNNDLTFLDCSGNQLTSLDLSGATSLIELGCAANNISYLDITNNYYLEYINFWWNALQTNDLSRNINLRNISCGGNWLYNLDLSNNINLEVLGCHNNPLQSLDLSNNINLTDLYCYENTSLVTLDLSNNSMLKNIECEGNLFTYIDLRNGNNSLINSITAQNNPNLNCIDVDDSLFCSNNWNSQNYYFDTHHYFSENCYGTTVIQEHTTNKEILKVTDLLGRETKQTNQPLFYIYDDGTVEKRIVVE